MAHYIDKSALVAEIEKLKLCTMDEHMNYYSAEAQGEYKALSKLESFIDTLEVKEVDLEKEYKDFVEKDPVYNQLVNGIVGKAIAKHFFELGLRSTITEEDCKLILNIGDEIPNMPEEEFFKELLKRYKAQKGEEI